MLDRTLFRSRNPPKFYSMSILHRSIFNDLLQAPQGSGGRHSLTGAQCRIKAIGSGAPAVGNSTRGRRAWSVIELEEWARLTASRSNAWIRMLMKLLLPRLLLLHDSNGRLYRSNGSGDKGNCRGSSKSSCSSALLLSDAANTLLLLLLLLLWLEQPRRLPNDDEVCSLIKTMNHQVQKACGPRWIESRPALQTNKKYCLSISLLTAIAP